MNESTIVGIVEAFAMLDVVVVDVEIKEDGDVIRVVVIVAGDKQTTQSLVETINKQINSESCNAGVLCRAERVDADDVASFSGACNNCLCCVLLFVCSFVCRIQQQQ